MLVPFCILIKFFVPAAPMSGNPARDLSVISGFDSRFDPAFWLINIRMDRPIERFPFSFFTGTVMQDPEAHAAVG